MAAVQDELRALHRAGKSMSSASKGREREDVVTRFLQRALPPAYRFGDGEIIDQYGSLSGRLDVVMEFGFAPTVPTVGSDTRLYLAEGVVVGEVGPCLAVEPG
jgi:hypothetical protein